MIGFFTGVEAFFTGLSRIHRLLPWILEYLLLLPLPFLLKFGISEYYVDLANRACLFILLSVGLNIVKGFCGQVTVGHIGLTRLEPSPPLCWPSITNCPSGLVPRLPS